MVKRYVRYYFGDIANCAIFRNVGLCNAVFVRRKIGPVKIEVLVLVVSLENKEKKYTEASDMGATPLHRNGLGQLLELVCHNTQLITVECIV